MILIINVKCHTHSVHMEFDGRFLVHDDEYSSCNVLSWCCSDDSDIAIKSDLVRHLVHRGLVAFILWKNLSGPQLWRGSRRKWGSQLSKVEWLWCQLLAWQSWIHLYLHHIIWVIIRLYVHIQVSRKVLHKVKKTHD